MGKMILWTVVGVLVGAVVGSVVIMGCHRACMLVYPPPEGLDIMNPDHEEQLYAWMETLPDGSFVLTALCHWIGTAVGAFVALLVTKRRSILPAIIVGALFTVAGIANAMAVPHPAWFPYVDIPGYLLVALLVGKLFTKSTAAADPQPS